jgi:hypothetical protein
MALFVGDINLDSLSTIDFDEFIHLEMPQE